MGFDNVHQHVTTITVSHRRVSLPWNPPCSTYSFLSPSFQSLGNLWYIYFFNLLLKKFCLYIYFFLFLAVLGLRFCVRAFSSCDERGPLFIAVCRPPTIVASLVVEHRLQMHRLSSCGPRAQLLCGMWDLPRPGLEPVSPVPAGRFPTTVPPGKPNLWYFYCHYSFSFSWLS